jgi:hypothetical protein
MLSDSFIDQSIDRSVATSRSATIVFQRPINQSNPAASPLGFDRTPAPN